MSIDFDSFEANVSAILNGSALDEAEKESVSGVLLEAFNSGDPIIDNLGRFALAIDTIRYLLYADKITTAQCGDLAALIGDMLNQEGDYTSRAYADEEEEEPCR